MMLAQKTEPKFGTSQATATKLLSASENWSPNSDLTMAIGADGRFYCGTMDVGEQQAGRLLAISFDEGVEQWCQQIRTQELIFGVTNGPVFFGGSMYHNDSQAQRIYQFSFNA